MALRCMSVVIQGRSNRLDADGHITGTRLKLNCVPPTVSYEKDSSTPGVHTFELQRNDYPTIPVGTISDYQRQPPLPQNQYPAVQANLHSQIAGHYVEEVPVYQHGSYGNPGSGQDALSYTSVTPTSMPAQEIRYQSTYTTPPPASHQNTMESWKPESPSIAGSTVDTLSEAMGGLKINHLATGKPVDVACYYNRLLTRCSTLYRRSKQVGRGSCGPRIRDRSAPDQQRRHEGPHTLRDDADRPASYAVF